MHYNNGRGVRVGDLVVGQTHNSRGALRLGVVKELMEDQGPCNVRLMIFARGDPDSDIAPRFMGGQRCHVVPPKSGETWCVEVAQDFADCKELVTVEDAFKAVSAIHDYALHDSRLAMRLTMEF